MGKEFTKEDVIMNKKDAIRSLNKLLEFYINDPNGQHLKKAHLMSYWLKDFVRYIKFEENFDPTKNISYKRGNVIKVNFGFNVGSEYGGLHYGIVLDKQNDHNCPVLTVIPLTSVKDSKEIHDNNVELGNEIYKLLKLKYDTISKSLKQEQLEIAATQSIIQNYTLMISQALEIAKKVPTGSNEFVKNLSSAEDNLDIVHVLQNFWNEKEAHNSANIKYLEKIGSEISRMKEGSIAIVNQITTVSKIRIFDPRDSKGVLSGISLSAESMEKINKKLQELYVF